jgi:hypothetical protein
MKRGKEKAQASILREMPPGKLMVTDQELFSPFHAPSSEQDKNPKFLIGLTFNEGQRPCINT